MDQQRFSYLLRQWQSGQCSEAENHELNAWLLEDYHDFVGEEDATIKEKLLQDFRAKHPYPASTVDKKPTGKTKIILWRWLAAAVLIGVAFTGIYFFFYSGNKRSAPVVAHDANPGQNGALLTLANGQQIILDSNGNGLLAKQQGAIVLQHNGQLTYQKDGQQAIAQWNTLTTPKGRQFNIVLPDGTHVWLNAQASLRFPTAFTGDARQVEMTGEAYFEVAHNTKQPFLVKANKVQVRVLGTHFNINAYADEGAIRTTLLQGAVEVTEGTQKQQIQPGWQATATHGQLSKSRANTAQAVAWKNGVFDFDGKNLQEVLRQLSRWYDVDIEYRGGHSDELFGGEIGRDLKLSQVLAGLRSMDVHFEINGKKLIVNNE